MEYDGSAPAALEGFLVGLPSRVGDAVGGDELRAALAGDLIGVRRSVESTSLWVGGRRLPSTLPRLVLDLGAPVDVRWLSDAWGVDAPVGVSGDVHQERWHLKVAGPELPDPNGRRIASSPLAAGRWAVGVALTDRPSGPLPGVVSGASPAYDLRTTGGSVASVSVERAWSATEVVPPDHPVVGALALGVGRVATRGWRPFRTRDAPSRFVVISHDDAPLALARFRIDRDALVADSFAVSPEAHVHHAGSALLDALEALALAEEVGFVRLDRSVVAVGEQVPFERHGYRRIGGGQVVAERSVDLPS